MGRSPAGRGVRSGRGNVGGSSHHRRATRSAEWLSRAGGEPLTHPPPLVALPTAGPGRPATWRAWSPRLVSLRRAADGSIGAAAREPGPQPASPAVFGSRCGGRRTSPPPGPRPPSPTRPSFPACLLSDPPRTWRRRGRCRCSGPAPRAAGDRATATCTDAVPRRTGPRPGPGRRRPPRTGTRPGAANRANTPGRRRSRDRANRSTPRAGAAGGRSALGASRRTSGSGSAPGSVSAPFTPRPAGAAAAAPPGPPPHGRVRRTRGDRRARGRRRAPRARPG